MSAVSITVTGKPALRRWSTHAPQHPHEGSLCTVTPGSVLPVAARAVVSDAAARENVARENVASPARKARRLSMAKNSRCRRTIDPSPHTVEPLGPRANAASRRARRGWPRENGIVRMPRVQRASSICRKRSGVVSRNVQPTRNRAVRPSVPTAMRHQAKRLKPCLET